MIRAVSWAALAAVLFVVAPARAQSAWRSAEWFLDPGPCARALDRQAIDELVRRDAAVPPFTEPSPLRIFVTVHRTARGFESTVQLQGPGSEGLVAPPAITASACANLRVPIAQQLWLLVYLVPRPPPEPAQSHSAPPTAQDVRPVLVEPTPAPPTVQPVPTRGSIVFGVSAAAFQLPTVTPGFDLGGVLQSGAFTGVLEAHASIPMKLVAEDGNATLAGRGLATALGCGTVRWFSFCGVVAAGALWGLRQIGEEQQPAATPFVEVGGRVVVSMRVAEHWAVGAHAGGGWLPVRTTILFSGSSFTTPPGVLDFGVSAQWMP